MHRGEVIVVLAAVEALFRVAASRSSGSGSGGANSGRGGGGSVSTYDGGIAMVVAAVGARFQSWRGVQLIPL